MIGPHLLGIEGLKREQVEHVLDTAQQFSAINERPMKRVPTLRGQTVINAFFEPSTRTKNSFEIAGKRLSADVINMGGKDSSLSKGETLIDTCLTLQAMNPDVVIMRHPCSGGTHLAAKTLTNCSVINAGDGLHEHPTQALLDALTIRQALGRIDGLTLTIVGDAYRGRVARSNILLHRLFGNKVRIVSPPTLAVKEFEEMGVEVYYDQEPALDGADVVMSLRMKAEYLSEQFVPNLDEYSRRYMVKESLLAKCCPKCIVLAPGPIMRGTEIETAVADGPRSYIRKQVNNGVAVRMAAIFLLATHGGKPDIDEE